MLVKCLDIEANNSQKLLFNILAIQNVDFEKAFERQNQVFYMVYAIITELRLSK